MNIQIISARSCKTCKYAVDAPGGLRECRWGPPSAQAMFSMTAQGPVVQGIVSVFPQNKPDFYCHQYVRGVEIVAGDGASMPINGGARP